jgi:hypothetical protein
MRGALFSAAVVIFVAAASANALLFTRSGSASSIGQVTNGTGVDAVEAELGTPCSPMTELDTGVGSYLLWHHDSRYQMVTFGNRDERSTGEFVSAPTAFSVDLCELGVPDDPFVDPASWLPAR